MSVTAGPLVTLEAKPGKGATVEEFLNAGRALVDDEPDTTAWFAIKLARTSYGIFDVFPDEAARTAHLHGTLARAQSERGDELFTKPLDIQPVVVLAAKLP